MDTPAKRGCVVKCSTAERHSPKRNSGWPTAQEYLFFLTDGCWGYIPTLSRNCRGWQTWAFVRSSHRHGGLSAQHPA